MPIARVLRLPALVLALCAAGLAGCGESSTPPAPQATPDKGTATDLRVLSNRADLISGGDALVEVVGTNLGGVRITVDGRDVSSAFALRPNGRYMGLVTGLADGPNQLATRGYKLTIVNHPRGGPVFSGPQIQPWTCAGEVQDAQCNREPTVEYVYKPAGGGSLAAYDPANPPGNVAQTTTSEGKTVPFIVRVETGNLNRDEYTFAVLWDPAAEVAPWSPPEGFNGRMVIYHGANCHTEYEMGSAPDIMNETMLGLGYVTMSHALNNSGHNCNMVTQAESMIMTKEHVIETIGELKYTIGSGCSGGALAQQWVANGYPGLYQGITPACSFTDAWTSGIQYSDYKLLRAYLEDPSRWAPGVVWEQRSIEAAIGHPNPANPVTFTEVISDGGNPARTDCPGVAEDQLYHPENNPGGVRCGLADWWVNVIGRRPPELWSPNEQQLGRGFAGAPFDNTGVQYGLNGLKADPPALTKAQFIDLNVKIGGFDVDRIPTAERSVGDTFAIERLARSGGANTASNLNQVAIIDLRGPDPGAFHDVYRTYVMRARLVREHGTADNQLLWRGSVALFGDATYEDDSILALSEWLDAVAADGSDKPFSQKLLDNRPGGVTHRCADGAGQDVPAEYCDAVVESYASPRIVAGMPFTDDVGKCQLKPHFRHDYYPVFFTDAEWERLDAVFPTGVCNYSLPGVGSQPTIPWLDYTDGPGGKPLGDAPRASRG